MELLKSIRGFEDYTISYNGVIIRNNKVVKPQLTRKGYLRVQLYYNGIRKSFYVHRLVCMAFIENHENKPQINHKNCIKTDNNYLNLEWCTNSENQIHAIKNNLKTIHKGVNVSNHKIDNNIALLIYNSPDSQRDIAKKYNVSQRLVLNIKKKRAWAHIHI